MRGSQLDRRVTIERPTQVDTDGYGPQPGPWVVVAARVPAQVRDDLPSKSEAEQAGMVVAKRPARLRMRYMRDLSSAMRVILHGDVDEIFQIVGGPAELGRRRWIEMTLESYSS